MANNSSHEGAEADSAGRLLARLRERSGEFVSGSRLGEALGVSRTAIWKQIKTLQGEGYGIESLPNKGYRLVHGPSTLNRREVASQLKTTWLGHPTQVLAETDSTNRVVMGDTTLGHGAVVAARRQLAGRGRLGRVWQTPDGSLAFSFLLSPPLHPRQAPLITLATAVGVVDGVARCCGIELDIKWPNDLLWQGKKVAGILTEVRSDPDRVVRAVVGIGLNVNSGDLNLALGGLAAPLGLATSLGLVAGRQWDLSTTLSGVLNGLEAAYDPIFSDPDGPAVSDLMARYRARCITVGQVVTVSGRAGQAWTGTATAVDPEGALLVTTADGSQERVFAGDVTLAGERPPELR